jgi:hypothetical protein
MTPDRFIAAAFREWSERKKGAGQPEDDIIYHIEQRAAELARESVGDGELPDLPDLPSPSVVTTEMTDGFCGDQVAYQQDWYTDEQMRSFAHEAIAWNTRAAGDKE